MAGAQGLVRHDSGVSASIARANELYTAATQDESRLLNGGEYLNLAPSYITGTPFLQSDKLHRGTIDYDGRSFTQVPLQYEQNQDQVLAFDSVRGVTIQLIREKVRFFAFDNYHFVWLPADSAGTLAAGFYDLKLDGPARLLVRRTKIITKSAAGRGLSGKFVEETRFFVQHQGSTYRVAKLGQLVSLFASKKAELQKYARANALKFNPESREASLVQLVSYYNELARAY
ncbi:hypothetical protein [Hymenobacter sp. BRD67]|uniref:hypothetical protein n=1 Tax=Hymenobacter sp. BRD67 TaxID=2675877 RepID=UPI0015631C7B|nr:hypothetical protein [Hymenobacter sp. BRD67]QKG53794.1 hypothetical protein GKZ67_15790 [Hymenobacter sp. BRD67]